MAKSKADSYKNDSSSGEGASPGKIFVGGLPKDTTIAAFTKHFGEYGEITDSVIMKDRYTGQPRGFGFITYADPSVVDKVIQETHIFNGKQKELINVEIKRTIPKGTVQSKDFKTKKIFVDEFKDFFSKYGKVVDHQIIRDHSTNRSRGFGFIIFDTEEIVDELLTKGNMLDMTGTQVEIKKAEPKKPSNPAGPPFGSDPRGRAFGDRFGGYADSYNGFGGGFGHGSYRMAGGLGPRLGSYGGYGGADGEFGGGYGGFGGSPLGGYRGESSFGYSGRLGSYGGGFGGGYSGGGLGGYSRGSEGYGGYGSGYDSGPGAGYGSGGLFGSRGGYGGSGRYHPYTR
ncbi:hypothetical protein ACLOJK_016003 [Asimina triloba]